MQKEDIFDSVIAKYEKYKINKKLRIKNLKLQL
jgi:hypothetical protein